MRVKAVAVVGVALAAVAVRGANGQTASPGPPIDTMVIRAHTYFLAHDLLEGRGTGRRGNDLSALYIATQAERGGLVPAGEGGSYYQAVPMVEAQIDTAITRLTLTIPGGETLRLGTPAGFIPNVGTAHTLISFAGELAYVGSAHDVLAQPGRLPALAGRVVVLRGMFGGDAAAADTLRARGATGVVHLIGAPDAYALYVRSRGPSRMYLADEAPSSFIPPIPAVIAGPALEGAILAGVADPDSGGPRLLVGLRVSATIAVRERRFVSRNVAAVLPGADPALRDEYVVFSAHHDHLGISEPDQHGDSIYNGFSDNAAGVAMLLAIADAMQRGPRPARSALFLWFTGEERGLLGSDYFAAHPTLPLARMAAVINLDAGAPPAPCVQWRINAAGYSTLGTAAIEVARRNGWDATAAPASPNSDYFPLLRMGVPAVSLVPGPGAYQGMTTEASQALFRRWEQYHQAGDQWFPDFPFGGLLRYAEYGYRLGMTVGSGPRPTLNR